MNHDELVFWIDRNAQKLADQIYPGWDREGIELWERAHGDKAIPVYRSPVVEKKTWEKPVGRNRIEGYIDLSMDVSVSVLVNGREMCKDGRVVREIVAGTMSDVVLFEAKPTIRSFGELFRQLRMYRAYAPSAKIAVVCPDERAGAIIREQGFLFFCPPGLTRDLFDEGSLL